MKKRDVYRLLILICCITMPLLCLAQVTPPDDNAPIDGGLSLLLAAGAAYGVKKYRSGRKKEVEG